MTRPTRLDTLSDRLLWLAGLLGLVLIAVVVNALLHGGENSLSPVAQAAERTAKMPGGKIALEEKISVEGVATTITATGSGSYDARSGRSEISLTVEVPGHTETFHAVGDDRRVFMRSPALSAGLPAGKGWLGIEPLLGQSAETAFGSGDAKSSLEMLKAVGDDVHSEGAEDVRGHPTTRYAGEIDLERARRLLEENGETELAEIYAALAGKIPNKVPFVVWIDDRGIARRIELTQQMPTVEGGPTVTATSTMELFAFGPQPKIELPPRGDVYDVTGKVREELGLSQTSA